MAIFLIFLLGIANFAMHKAVMASDHAVVVSMRRALFGGYGAQVFFALEFGVLIASLAFAAAGSGVALFAYAGYTALNGVSAWALLSGKM